MGIDKSCLNYLTFSFKNLFYVIALTLDEQQRWRCDRLHRRRPSQVSFGGMSVRKLHHRRDGRRNEGRHCRHQQRSHQRLIRSRSVRQTLPRHRFNQYRIHSLVNETLFFIVKWTFIPYQPNMKNNVLDIWKLFINFVFGFQAISQWPTSTWQCPGQTQSMSSASSKTCFHWNIKD